MKVVKVDEVKPGMILAKNAVDLRGRVLLVSGKGLTDKHIRIFQTWGVTEVTIQDDDNSGTKGKVLPDKDSPLFRKLEKEFSELFGFSDMRHPAIKELYKLSFMRRWNAESGDDQ